jgi:citrate lyase subunit beta/citryl-CoA lyase
VIIGPALLFCPGDRADRYEKAAAAADSVIIDLEDAVGPDNKPRAREALVASDLDPSTTIVRVNPVATPHFTDDLLALRCTRYTTVMLPKAETVCELSKLDGFEVIALCESPLGVRNADAIAAHPNVVALTWGAEDLVAAIGGNSSREVDGGYRQLALYARSRVLIAAASEGKPAFDTVHLDIADELGLRAEAEDAAASGFVGSMCIHPSQVPVIRAAFMPSADSVIWATSVLERAATTPGVFAFEGRMIDEPVLRQARSILAASVRSR